eukprot:5548629-Pleurochrysis_carterae.AAC.2
MPAFAARGYQPLTSSSGYQGERHDVVWFAHGRQGPRKLDGEGFMRREYRVLLPSYIKEVLKVVTCMVVLTTAYR